MKLNDDSFILKWFISVQLIAWCSHYVLTNSSIWDITSLRKIISTCIVNIVVISPSLGHPLIYQITELLSCACSIPILPLPTKGSPEPTPEPEKKQKNCKWQSRSQILRYPCPFRWTRVTKALRTGLYKWLVVFYFIVWKMCIELTLWYVYIR